jgi:hypothetical protein
MVNQSEIALPSSSDVSEGEGQEPETSRQRRRGIRPSPSGPLHSLGLGGKGRYTRIE